MGLGFRVGLFTVGLLLFSSNVVESSVGSSLSDLVIFQRIVKIKEDFFNIEFLRVDLFWKFIVSFDQELLFVLGGDVDTDGLFDEVNNGFDLFLKVFDGIDDLVVWMTDVSILQSVINFSSGGGIFVSGFVGIIGVDSLISISNSYHMDNTVVSLFSQLN